MDDNGGYFLTLEFSLANFELNLFADPVAIVLAVAATSVFALVAFTENLLPSENTRSGLLNLLIETASIFIVTGPSLTSITFQYWLPAYWLMSLIVFSPWRADLLPGRRRQRRLKDLLLGESDPPPPR